MPKTGAKESHIEDTVERELRGYQGHLLRSVRDKNSIEVHDRLGFGISTGDLLPVEDSRARPSS